MLTPAARAAAGEESACEESSKLMSPASALSAPPMIRVRVDLPAPFSPTSAWISPRPTSSETPSRARTTPKRLETSATRSRSAPDFMVVPSVTSGSDQAPDGSHFSGRSHQSHHSSDPGSLGAMYLAISAGWITLLGVAHFFGTGLPS